MRVAGLLTRLAVAGIALGILGMIQPFVFDLFRWGFLLLLVSTLVYTVVARLPEPPRAAALPDEASRPLPGAAESPT